ncbi:hypothetical protein DSO57_1030507 [Entomophthora muscae]|uniref:Uncharacterized protein n=1 Tax=Entomophthora muscae TaxID=34485 RepID=A0ACC2TCG5_9FUNG|nr:hypothetical protein DSO57_1030507 [Entomophthora muscae]
MILPVLKFVILSLAPFLLLLWSTLPDLWPLESSQWSSLSGETVVKSLTCNDLDFYTFDYTVPALTLEVAPVSTLLSLEENNLVPIQAPVKLSPAPTCTPWLLTRLVLMGLNAYFPQLSPASSLWSPLCAAIPVLHWVASRWFISPGWEPNLVSLARLSYTTRLQMDQYPALPSELPIIP